MNAKARSPVRLLKAAAAAARRAYCPYSGFRVGAAILAEDGRIFTGCNVENASYGLTVCAERNAVAAAVAAGARRISAAAVVGGDREPARPCGACRQVLAEFAPRDARIYCATPDRLQRPESWRIRELLPETFVLRSPRSAPRGRRKS